MDYLKLLHRHTGNPVLKAADLPDCACVFNSGATVCGERIFMLLNIWDSQWAPKFLPAWSMDGIHFEVGTQSMAQPPEEYPYVRHEGIFDTRITRFEEDDCFYITYNAGSHLGGRIILARSRDLATLEPMGFITGPDHRNCVIFPEKIRGYYARLERPNVGQGGDIYLSYSPDLIHWGQTELVLEHNARYWESAKIGPGAPPVKTPEGWLCVYHGVRESMNGFTYNAGVMLLDLENPARVIGKCPGCILSPEEPYECNGKCPNVVFPTAVLRHGTPGMLKIYYGAADSSIGLATAAEAELLAACR